MDKKVKKLTLNRETVKKMFDEELRTVAGGATETVCTACPRMCSDPCTSGDCSITRSCSGCCM
jgi:natural product precursor